MKRVLGALGLIVAISGPAVALDLKKAKFPIEYECRVTHAAGIILEESGKWVAGSIEMSDAPSKVVIERFERVSVRTRKDACTLSKARVGYPNDDGFCLTYRDPKVDESKVSVSYFCKIFNAPWRQSANGVLDCANGATVVDTNQGVMITGLSAGGFLVSDRSYVQKSDCTQTNK